MEEDKKLIEMCERYYIYELMYKNNINFKEAKKYVLDFGIPKEVLEVYKKIYEKVFKEWNY